MTFQASKYYKISNFSRSDDMTQIMVAKRTKCFVWITAPYMAWDETTGESYIVAPKPEKKKIYKNPRTGIEQIEINGYAALFSKNEIKEGQVNFKINA